MFMEKRNKNKDKSLWSFSTIEEPEKVIVEEKVQEIKEEPVQEIKKEFQPYRIKVNYQNLFVRKEPAVGNNVVGVITYGQEFDVIDEQNGFGKIEDGKWIMLSFTVKI